jgi:hypothetical protein
MEDWLTTHAAFVTCIAAAVYVSAVTPTVWRPDPICSA